MRKTKFRWVPWVAVSLHVFLFGLLLNGFSLPFAIIFLADIPVSVIAFGAMFGGSPHAMYFLAAWGIVGTVWWFFLGLLIQVKMTMNRRQRGR